MSRYFGGVVRAERNSRTTMSQTQAALALGVSSGYMSRVESGKKRPSEHFIRRMAALYGSDLGALLHAAGIVPQRVVSALRLERALVDAIQDALDAGIDGPELAAIVDEGIRSHRACSPTLSVKPTIRICSSRSGIFFRVRCQLGERDVFPDPEVDLDNEAEVREDAASDIAISSWGRIVNWNEAEVIDERTGHPNL